MNNMRRILIAIPFLLVSAAVHSENGDNVIIGETVKLQSTLLQKEIKLSIHVPDNHDGSTDRYPVLYTFQTHFEQVAGAVKNLYDYALIPEMMVVRIDNYEFGYLTPTVITGKPNSGKADKFLEFFEKELLPFVDSRYRTHPYRIVFSNSWGAMFVAYAILSRPALFNAGIASIPWIMYDGEDRFILNNVKQFLETREYNNFLYMTMDDELDVLPDFSMFVEIMRDNPVPGLDWEYHHWPEEDHTSTPYRSIYSGLRALYTTWSRIPEDVISKGVTEIRQYELTLNGKFGYNIGVSGVALRLAGQSLQKQSEYKRAIAIYEYATDKDPNNAFAYVSLGRALEADDQLKRAREAYEAAYRIAESTSHPQIKWIKNFLENVNAKIDTKDG
jgi:predicted alpha/beta superfamily hydrolase